jgi:Domain of unknown function (DUF4159)
MTTSPSPTYSKFRRFLVLGVLLVLVAAPLAWSQRRAFVEPNVPYDGRFTFVRLRYTQGYRMAWSADYPAMERNFMAILGDLSVMRVHRKGSNVHVLNDPQLAHYPVAYLTEPGYWYPTDEEALALRNWILKGGFLIVDDFYFERQWAVFEAGMRKVMPEARIEPLTVSHPVFHSFFSIRTLDGMTHPATPAAKAVYLGIHEDNDPAKRLQVVINFNNDIGDYMEWSGEGWYPVNLSNDAYKFATNYVVYGLTH